MYDNIKKCPECGSQNIVASAGSDFVAAQESKIPKVFEDHHLSGNCGKVFSGNPIDQKLSELSVSTIHGENLLIERISTEKVILKVTDIKNNLVNLFEFKGREVAKAEDYYKAFLKDN